MSESDLSRPKKGKGVNSISAGIVTMDHFNSPSITSTYVAGPGRWLRRIGYQRSYGDLCDSDALLGGDPNTQYVPYCGNKCPVRLLITVLLYFLWVQHHEYVAAVMVLSQKYSSTYGLTLTCLSYAANLSSATIQCAPNTYGTKDTHY